MGCFSPDIPEPPSPGTVTRETLQAQIDTAPDLVAAEQQFRPQLAQLDADIAAQITPQLLDLFKNQISPVLSGIAATDLKTQRESDISFVEDNAARVRGAFESADPRAAELRDQLNESAISQLGAGANLDPALARQVQQSARAAQSARGFGFSARDANEEVRFSALEADRLRRNREQFAQGVAGLNAASVDPFQALLARPGQNPLSGLGVVNQAQSFNPGQVFDPTNPALLSLANAGFNAQAQGAISGANNLSGLLGAGISAAGNAGGGLFGGLFGG